MVVEETTDTMIREEETTIKEEMTTIEEMTEENLRKDQMRNLNPISTLFCVIYLTMLEKSMYILKILYIFALPSNQNILSTFNTAKKKNSQLDSKQVECNDSEY